MNTNTETYGIENVRPAVVIVSSAITAAANIDTNQDGDIATLEIFNALQTVAFKAFKNIPDLPKLKDEFTDLSEEEKAEIKTIVTTEVDLPNDEVEPLVERTIGVLIDVVDLAIDFSKFTNKDTGIIDETNPEKI